MREDSCVVAAPFPSADWLPGAFLVGWLLIDHMPPEFCLGPKPIGSGLASEGKFSFKEDFWGSWDLYSVDALVIKDGFLSLQYFNIS